MTNLSHTLPKGFIAAVLTPMRSDLTIDIEMLCSHARWCLDNGSDAIALFGTTGEANSISLIERKKVLEEVLRCGLPARQLLVGTGCCSLPETRELTEHASSNNVGGVLMLPPFYYKNVP